MSENATNLKRRLIVGLATAALLATVASSSPQRALGAARPPCTRSALVSGLRRGFHPFPHGKLVHPWGCAGQFAYAAVIVEGNEITQLFHAKSGAWITANRGRYCVDGEVPARIYQPACNTN
jgi:hypothetical protein